MTARLRNTVSSTAGVMGSSAMISAGVGDGRFQTEDDWLAGRNGVGLFGSLAVRVAAPLSVVADWTGQDLMILGSIAPFRNFGMVVSAGTYLIPKSSSRIPSGLGTRHHAAAAITSHHH